MAAVFASSGTCDPNPVPAILVTNTHERYTPGAIKPENIAQQYAKIVQAEQIAAVHPDIGSARLVWQVHHTALYLSGYFYGDSDAHGRCSGKEVGNAHRGNNPDGAVTGGSAAATPCTAHAE